MLFGNFYSFVSPIIETAPADESADPREPAQASKFSDATRECASVSSTGDGWTVEQAIDAYLRSQTIAATTVASYRTTSAKWSEWSKAHRIHNPMRIRDVTAGDLSHFLRWTLDTSIAAADGNPENTRNKHRAELHAVFRWMTDEQRPVEYRLASMPAFPGKLKARKVAGLVYFTADEYAALYQATIDFPTPREWHLPYAIGPYLRAAMVLTRRIPLDTGTIMPYLKNHRIVLCWQNVISDRLPPGRPADIECETGHLVVKRQKSGKLFMRPVDRVLRAHLEVLRHPSIGPLDPVFGRRRPDSDRTSLSYWTAGGSRPCETLQALIDRAGVSQKIVLDADGNPIESAWTWKDFRKTHATDIDRHRAGLATDTMGHSRGGITHEHYGNTLPAIYEGLKTFPPHPCELQMLTRR